jgi:hypothetical protein
MENNQPLFSYGSSTSGLFSNGSFNLHFNPDGFYNGKNSWLSDDLSVKIIWDTTLSAWKLSGTSLGTAQVINTNTANPPINGNWTVLGARYNAAATQGECVPINHLTGKVEFTSPGCVCDGSINVTASGGVPPYQYSYNGGVTYVTTPIKTGMCGGVFIVKVKDSENTVVTQSITIPDATPAINYTANLNIASTTNITNTSVEYLFSVDVFPPLPDGVTMTFDLNLLAMFIKTPYINSASSTFSPEVLKNTQLITGSDNTTQTEVNNTAAGCQGYKVYRTNYSRIYQSLTITNTDTYSIKVITDYELTCRNTPDMYAVSNDELGPLTFDLEDYTITYMDCCQALFQRLPTSSFISNLSMNGCDCCTVSQSNYTKSLYE